MYLVEKIQYQLSETKWNYNLDFVFNVSVSLFFIVYVLLTSSLSVFLAIGLMLSGLLTFTLVEYMFHAWLFHRGHNAFVRGHAKHHKNPIGYESLPFFAGSLIAVLLYFLFSLLLVNNVAMLFSASILLGYSLFGVYHGLMHRINFKDPYGKYMQQFHYVHHLCPKKNHGVTTPLWDLVFRTYEPLSKHDLNKNLKVKPEERLIKE